ncbi:TPA: DUF6673 family protein [Clostridioides difficile]
MIINNIELEDLEIYDADVMKRVETSIKTAIDGIQIAETEEKENHAIFRRICDLIFECFDNVFGDNTSNKIFNGKRNVKVCMIAFSELADEVERQKKEGMELFSSIGNKYSPNRTQRRTKK